MKLNKWTIALVAAGVVSVGSVAHAEEAANQVLTALSSTTLSGYIDTSVNWRPGNDAGPLPGRTFDGADKQDGFNLNVVNLTLEKPLDEGNWSAGYKADLVFGPDASYYSTVLNGGAPAAPDDFNIKQAYAALRAPIGNGIDFKLGVFDTIIGYEVFESGNNPNYSRSYGYGIEPTHHTGLLATYHINDNISIAAGVANTSFGMGGAGSAINGKVLADTQKTFMGAVTFTLPENTGIFAGSALYAGVVDGRALANAGEDSTSYYVGHTMRTPLEGLAIGAALDYGSNVAGGLNHAWAAALYASYQATEKLRLNLRADYTEASSGFYYGAPAGDDDELGALTVTADYALWSGLITRLEGRWDHSFEGDAFDFGTEDDAFTVALNMVYKF